MTLPGGNYQCRLLLTEESFHNSPPKVHWPWGMTRYADGGFWAHALSDDEFAFTIVPPASSTEMHVASIAMALQQRGPSANATATVLVVDANGVPVSGVTVSGTWSGVVSGSASGTTDSLGAVTLASPKTRSSGTFTFTVGNLSKTGWDYDPTANAETSDSIIR